MRSLPSRKPRLHSRVHKSVPAHIALEFHNPTQTQISQNESHRRNQIDSKRYVKQTTASRESQKQFTQPKARNAMPLLRPTTATGVYRSVAVLSPICKSPKSSARNTSCLKHKTAPQRKRQASPGHDCSAPSKRPCHYSISHKSDPTEANLELQCHESIQSLTNHNPHHKRLKYHQNKEKLKQSYRR